jgi:hypothetical protein
MDDQLSQFISDLIGRLNGPFSFRFVLQPLMATLYALRDGVADSRANRSPYFWSLFTEPDQRRQRLREGWKAVARVVALGVLMDLLYQLLVFRWVHPLQLAVVVLGLALLPYVLLRGPVERIASWWTTRKIHATPRRASR